MHVRMIVTVLVLAAVPASAQAPYLVKDIWPGPPGSEAWPVAAGDRVFVGATTDVVGSELGVSDGTAAGTVLLDLVPGPTGFGPSMFFTLNGDLLFRSISPSLPGLWKSDGTLAGTVPIADVTPPFGRPLLAYLPGRALFAGSGPLTGDRVPWVTDGTSAGTRQVPAPLGATPVGAAVPESGSAFADGFAIAMDNFHGTWWTDGAAMSTTHLTSSTVNPANCSSTAAAGGRLLLHCTSSSFPEQLAVSDGTFGGTRLLPVALPFGISELVPAGSLVYFTAGGVMYRTDGTVAGTLPVPFGPETPTNLILFTAVASNGILYFGGTTPGTGRELWRTDGTAAGTFLLRDIEPGPGSGISDNAGRHTTWIEAAAGGVVFAATTTAGGTEVWESDGTSAGTVPRPEIVPGPGSSNPRFFAAAGGRVFFQAQDGVTGNELWAIDVRLGAAAADDTSVTEGDAGTTEATFTVRLQSASPVSVEVGYATVPVTATAGTDYETRTGALTFAPGEREKSVAVPVLADTSYEGNESFGLVLTAVGGAVIADGRADAVIIDDDDRPVVRLAGRVFLEGQPDPFAPYRTLSVTVATQDGTSLVKDFAVPFTWLPGNASLLSDYLPAASAVTFPAGAPSGTTLPAPVFVTGDTVPEADETFTLAVAARDAGTVEDETAVGLILDDDGAAVSRPRELVHGASLRVDLAASGDLPARHNWVLAQAAGASYEVVVDEVSGDAAPLGFARLGADGSTVVQSASPVGAGAAASLRWRSLTPGVAEHVSIASPACDTACGTDDTYRLRFYETTLRAPRFNNANGQATVLVLQNATDRTVTGVVHAWRGDGTALGSTALTIPPRGTFVHDLAATLPGASGSLTVAHDGPYGGLAGKAVALDPANGFSFDTPLTARPR